MDPVTHALFGANTGQWLYGQQHRKIWLAGALAGICPDLDILIRSATDPMVAIVYHRHFTHSLLFAPIMAIMFAAVWRFSLGRLWQMPWRVLFFTAWLSISLHALLDTCTSYGTLLLWPLTDYRYAWDIISVVDPVVTGLLGIGLWLGFKRYKRCFYALWLLIICYFFLGFWQHHRAWQAQTWPADVTLQARRVTPTLGNIWFWRGMGRSEQRMYLQSITVLPWQVTATPNRVFPLFSQTHWPDDLANNPRAVRAWQRFRWFSDGFVVANSYQPLILADARYLRSVNPPIALWGLGIDGNQLFWQRGIDLSARVIE